MKRLIFVLSLLASPAIAADAPPPRTIDMTTVIVDLQNKPVPDSGTRATDDPTCAHCSPLTLGTVVAAGLLTPGEADKNLDAVQKAKRGMLAQRLMADKAAQLSAQETADILLAIKGMPPLILMRVVPLLDPAAMKSSP